MTQHFYIGVDGGATKTIVRVEDSNGKLLGSEVNGPANIRISVDQAWQSIYAALEKILHPLAIFPNEKRHCFHAGMGLAGCEMLEAYQTFLNQSHPFDTLIVSSDSHTACIGAHGGQDGAIIIAGTGVVGFQLQKGKSTKVSGWGFPQDDEGGGAWLGLNAVKICLQWIDGRRPVSGLAKAVYAYFDENLDRLVSWTSKAYSTLYAELAPLVIQQSKVGDTEAIALLQQAAFVLTQIGHALHMAQHEQTQALPCSLVGSIAPFLEPYLDANLRVRLRPCQFTPDAGAVLLVQHYLDHK